jgi:hypothetical protein
VLDEAGVRGRVSQQSRRKMHAWSSDWAKAGGSRTGATLLQSVQGVVLMLASSEGNDRLRARAFDDYQDWKRAWRVVADSVTEASSQES